MKHFSVEEFACKGCCGKSDMSPKFLAMIDAAREMGHSEVSAMVLAKEVVNLAGDLEAAEEQNRNLAKATGETTDELDEQTGAAGDLTDATKKSTTATKENDAAQRRLEESARKAAGGVRDLWRAQNESLSPFASARRAAEDVAKAQDEYNESVRQFGPTSAQAQSAAFSLALAQSSLEGALLDVSEAGDDAVATFLDMARKAGVSDASLKELERGLRLTKGAADGLAGTYQVQVDARVDGALNAISAVQRAINNVNARQIQSVVNRASGGIFGRNPVDRHTGGRVAPGQLVQPLSGELFVPDTPGRVLSREDSARAAGGVAVLDQPQSAPSYTINVTAGMGANGDDIGRQVVDAIKRYERSNGTRWRS
jgi:hypothetical protein